MSVCAEVLAMGTNNSTTISVCASVVVMAFTATARRIGNSLEHEVDVNGRHRITTDEPLSLGGTNQGPAPHELLPAALASCVATMVAIYADRHHWDIGEASVDVVYDNEATPRRCEIALHLPSDLSPEQVERLERVAETCPIRRALEVGFVFEEKVLAPAGTV